MLIILFIASFITIICCDCDDEILTTKHYYELGCKPVYNSNGNRIAKFDCPDFEALDKAKCHYKTKTYNNRDFIEKEHLADCEGSCFCGGQYEGSPSQFVCNYKFCQEQVIDFIGHCVFQRSFNNCCADNIICDEKSIQSLHQCHFNDKIYHEGEFMYPTDRCYTYKCLCDKNFNTSIESSKNPKCQLLTERCNIELRQLYNYQTGCAPVYFGKFPNCPSDYRCPKDIDKVLPSEYKSSSEDTCKFGKLVMNKGDRLDDNCYNCTCIVPPILFCRQYTNC